MTHPNLIVGMEHSEDAGVYRLRDDLAIIQTVDFFTPIVNDPYLYGQIAVANALSDVYAMGGTPLTALNIVCYPVNTLPLYILKDILRGGWDKMKEAEVLLVGGHSVDDIELKYGLAVTGIVHPERVVMNRGAIDGDTLILTKPLGTGIINTAVKAGMASAEAEQMAIGLMTALNKTAAHCMIREPGVHACTDVTGFGLLGHLGEMIVGTKLEAVIDSAEIGLLPGLQELIETGLTPGGLYRNRDYWLTQVDISAHCPPWLLDALFDPQTSGGLLIAVASSSADHLLHDLHKEGVTMARIIGNINQSDREKIVIQ